MARKAKALETLLAQVNALAPKRSKKEDGWLGDDAHAARKSDHNPNRKGVVQAIDITHDPKGGCDSYALADLLRSRRDMRIKYIISNGKIASSTEKPWQWRKYNGANKHDKHVHVSVSDVASLYDDPKEWNLDGFVEVPVPPDVDPLGDSDDQAEPLTFADASTKPLVKSKTFWASVAAVGSQVGAIMTDWRFIGLALLVAIVGYIIWERNGKPDIRGWFK